MDSPGALPSVKRTLLFSFFLRGSPPTQASAGRGFVFLWKHLAITVGISPSAVTALTQGLDRVSLLEVAVLKRGHVLKRVPNHQLELIQAFLLEQNRLSPLKSRLNFVGQLKLVLLLCLSWMKALETDGKIELLKQVKVS